MFLNQKRNLIKRPPYQARETELRVDPVCLHLALSLPITFPISDFPNSTQLCNKEKGSHKNIIQNLIISIH